jgi:hypothetical protein
MFPSINDQYNEENKIKVVHERHQLHLV